VAITVGSGVGENQERERERESTGREGAWGRESGEEQKRKIKCS
jgi:hypothetical protein